MKTWSFFFELANRHAQLNVIIPPYRHTGIFMARWIMTIGAILFLTGAVIHYAPWMLSWFGKLPGDIHIESEKGHIFIPITSMIIISILLTVILNIFRR